MIIYMEKNLNINYGKPIAINNLGKQIQPFVLPIVTAIGAFGGFPTPPKFFLNIIKNEIVQYFLLYLLIWQGGANQSWKLSLKVTLAIYIIITVGHIIDMKSEKNN